MFSARAMYTNCEAKEYVITLAGARDTELDAAALIGDHGSPVYAASEG